MVWGQKQGVSDWAERLAKNDPKLTSLTVLRFRKFGHEEVLELCASLAANTTLTELSASGHSMEPRTAETVAELLCSNTTLSRLCVGDSNFGSQGVQALSRGVAGSASLQVLDLEQKGLDSTGMEKLGASVAVAPRLTTLLLARNPIGDDGVAALCRHGLGHLQELDLQECGLGAKACAALASGEPSCSSLRRLFLNDNALGGGVTQLGGLLSGLNELCLRNTGLGDKDFRVMMAAVPPDSRLELLDLSGNKLTLADGAPTFPVGLQRLLLRGNSIGDAGAAALCAQLSSFPDLKLQELDLGDNQVRGGAVEPLNSVHIIKLGLFACGLGDEGVQALAKTASQGGFSGVEELDLAGCGMGMGGAQSLMDALVAGAMPALTVLLLGANPAIEEERWEAALEALRNARSTLDVMWRTNDPSGATPPQ